MKFSLLSLRPSKNHIVLGVCLVVSVVSFGIDLMKDHAKASAAPLPALHGFAWSDMPGGSDECIVGDPGCGGNSTNLSSGRGAGWISMNNGTANFADAPAVGGAPYKVTVDPANGGVMSGYAWSENMGWVSFTQSDLSGCPNNPFLNSPCQAKINLQTGEVTGWIRALASSDPEAGGWDGWISLSSISDGVSSPDYGVHANLQATPYVTFSGMAWGGTNMGWVDFSKVTMDPINAPLTLATSSPIFNSCSSSQLPGYLDYLSPGNPQTPFSSCTFTVTPPSGGSANTPVGNPVLGNSWSTNLPHDSLESQLVLLSNTTGTYTFGLSCINTATGASVQSVPPTVQIVVQKPSAAIAGAGNCIPTTASTGTLAWSVVNVVPGSCSVNGILIATATNDTVYSSGVPSTPYTMTCTSACNGLSISSNSATITQSPTCTAANPIPIFREI